MKRIPSCGYRGRSLAENCAAPAGGGGVSSNVHTRKTTGIEAISDNGEVAVFQQQIH